MSRTAIEKLIYVVISVVLIIGIVCLLVGLLAGKGSEGVEDSSSPRVSYGDKKKLYEEAQTVSDNETITIDTETVSEGLRKMGILVTEEYYFTQIEKITKTKKWAFFASEATAAFSYDGTVSAGIDCNEIDVEKDDENKIIKITIPRAEIRKVDIDHDSLQVFEETERIWTKLNIADYNDALVDLEAAAREKADKKGIIEKADKNARGMIESFAGSLVESDEYKIEVKTRGQGG